MNYQSSAPLGRAIEKDGAPYEPSHREVVAVDNKPEFGETRASALQIGLTALGVIAVVSIVIYGLNNQRDETQSTASPPTEANAPANTPPANAPQQGQAQPNAPQAQPQQSAAPGDKATPNNQQGNQPNPTPSQQGQAQQNQQQPSQPQAQGNSQSTQQPQAQKSQ